MESLIRQMRVKHSGVSEKPGDTSSTRDKRVTPKKSVSFKEEKKKPQNWFQRQLSRQMSGKDYDPVSDMDYITAVAAAAYAITYIEQTEHEKQSDNKPEIAMARPKSRREDVVSMQEPGSSSKRFSGQDSMRNPGKQDKKVQFTSSQDAKKPEKPPPSFGKASTFAINFDGSDKTQPRPDLLSTEPETPKPKPKPAKPRPGDEVLPKLDLPPIARPSPKPEPAKTRPGNEGLPKPELPPIVKPPPPPANKGLSLKRHSLEEEGAADSWERAELAKIKERYEKLQNKIASFEEKKKSKARRKLDRAESELEIKRKRALQKFREDIEYIDQIVGGAKAQAEERRRNEELKVKEKANAIRATGKVPPTCFCF